MGKPPPTPGMGFVEPKAAPDNREDLIVGKNTRNLHAQAGMTSEAAAKKNPEPGGCSFKGTCGTGAHAFAAGKTGLGVYFRAHIFQDNGLFRADFHTGFTV